MKTDLIYGVEDRPPFKDALFAALQHLLAIFVAIITPPLIIASALKLDVEKTSFLVSMSLFASGVSTFIQCRRFGPIGAKLLCIQGTSFSFIGPIIATGMVGGLPLIFGSCMAAAPIEMIVSRTFKYFLYEKQDRDYLCEWKRVSIPFYIFFPCTTAWRFSSDYSRNNEQLCKFPLRD